MSRPEIDKCPYCGGSASMCAGKFIAVQCDDCFARGPLPYDMDDALPKGWSAPYDRNGIELEDLHEIAAVLMWNQVARRSRDFLEALQAAGGAV